MNDCKAGSFMCSPYAAILVYFSIMLRDRGQKPRPDHRKRGGTYTKWSSGGVGDDKIAIAKRVEECISGEAKTITGVKLTITVNSSSWTPPER